MFVSCFAPLFMVYALVSGRPSTITKGNARSLSAVESWPQAELKLGQVAGVDTDKDGHLYLMHRADRHWGRNSFDESEVFTEKEQGPISDNIIIKLDARSGEVLEKRGANTLYLPHGLTVDGDGNLWITDVALHQVLMFPPGSDTPSLTLGEAFVPGDDHEHFCKPTDVAVASNGEFFVADGYCNGRIMKFASDGRLLAEWGELTPRPVDPMSEFYNLHVPHSLVLNETDDLLCVADREHERVVCYRAGMTDPEITGNSVGSVDYSRLGKVYAITFHPDGSALYAVTGDQGSGQVPAGSTFSTDKLLLTDIWGPNEGFGQPHDIAASPDGKHVYVADIVQNRVIKFTQQTPPPEEHTELLETPAQEEEEEEELPEDEIEEAVAAEAEEAGQPFVQELGEQAEANHGDIDARVVKRVLM